MTIIYDSTTPVQITRPFGPAPVSPIAAPYDRAESLRAYQRGSNDTLAGHRVMASERHCPAYQAGVRSAEARLEAARNRGYVDGLDESPVGPPEWFSPAERLAYREGEDEAGLIHIAREDAKRAAFEDEQEIEHYMRKRGGMLV